MTDLDDSQQYTSKQLGTRLKLPGSTVRSMGTWGALPAPDVGGTMWSAGLVNRILEEQKFRLPVDRDFPIYKDLPPVVDLFSGCGGFSLGFRKAGFEVAGAFDNWDVAVRTYNANFGHEAYQCDVGNFAEVEEKLAPFFADHERTPGIIGGPPCQDFSCAGYRLEGARAKLTEVYARLVARFGVPFFVMENVPQSARSQAYRQAMSIFEQAGYTVARRVLCASYCGVPQRRYRLFTVGGLESGLADCAVHAWDNTVSETEMTLRDWFGDSLGSDFVFVSPRHYENKAVFSVDEPAPVMRGSARPIPSGFREKVAKDAGPVSQSRVLMTRERASVQTFPGEFRFVASKTDADQLIGNAVPVELGRFVAEGVRSFFERSRV